MLLVKILAIGPSVICPATGLTDVLQNGRLKFRHYVVILFYRIKLHDYA